MRRSYRGARRRRYSWPIDVRPPIVALLLCVLLLGSAAPALARRDAGAVTVTVTAGRPTENAFTLSRATVPVGTVVFDVVNRGRRAHAFSIAGKKTPLLAPGRSATLTV